MRGAPAGAALLVVTVAGLAATRILAASPSPGPEPSRLVVERVISGAEQRRSRWLRRVAGLEGRETRFQRPYGVAWHGDELLVADPTAGRLWRVDIEGRVEPVEAPLTGPIGVASCRSGVVLTDSRAGTALLFSRDFSSWRPLKSGLVRPTGVACRDDQIFIVETGTHRVLTLDASGTVLHTVGGRGDGETQLNFPAAIAVSARELFIGDTLNFRVQIRELPDLRFSGGFGQIGDEPGDTPRIKGLAIDARRLVWISDALLDRVTVLADDGTLVAEIGRPGTRPGEFSFPAGIAIHPDGRIAVADSLNRRVQVLRLEGSEETREGRNE